MSGAVNHHLHPTMPEGVREALEQINLREIVCTAINRMRRSGESKEMCARWVSDEFWKQAALTTTPSRGLVDAAELVREQFVNKDINLAIPEAYRDGYSDCASEIEEAIRTLSAKPTATADEKGGAR